VTVILSEVAIRGFEHKFKQTTALSYGALFLFTALLSVYLLC